MIALTTVGRRNFLSLSRTLTFLYRDKLSRGLSSASPYTQCVSTDSLKCAPFIRLINFAGDERSSSFAATTRSVSEQPLTVHRSSALFGGIAASHPSLSEYRLPTVWYNGGIKKTIVDPTAAVHRAYELPTLANLDVKDAPSTRGTPVSVDDPLLAPDVVKITMPYLVTIRHKKMKKHKLRKLKKRRRFVIRKRKMVKLKRKEKSIQEYERKTIKESEDYDPEKYIAERMELARKGGWGIDVVAEYDAKRQDRNSVNN